MRTFTFEVQSWPLKEPFSITGHTWTNTNILFVTISENGVVGRGEATGVYYLGENGDSMLRDAESVRSALESGANREQLLTLLPHGGARNAIDSALWDLEAKRAGTSIFELSNVTQKEIHTVNTIGIDTPEVMAAKARAMTVKNIKVKLNGERAMERISAVCEARPDASIVVDVNQGWTFEQLVELAPRFKALGIKMIEQPLPRGEDADLEDYDSPITLCADESCLDTSELEQASRRYQMINIKLDKTGGLTEALKLARQATDKGLKLMVGNMMGTSLGMAPAFVIAQLCEYVDLDGALFLSEDREHPMSYEDGLVTGLTPALWG
ncbi:dipeptide epimerase [Pseudomaricurvus alkylphenolicus]|uniref:N-acetyl-D-Glu racemase DgcA n=1 Tax=Pseudomaricurvus alkylphenolicus TaxID=1306991 RepID=UPI0014221876|nr:N-acetyl-D-Glu racemase DgcA [Pseudomaricurvus alkylphenolicus]NIB38672.1 dipeptide epimerase [Pseudomaricurvus alkylphenolicus]